MYHDWKPYIDVSSSPERLIYNDYDAYLHTYISNHTSWKSYEHHIHTTHDEIIRCYVLPAHTQSDTTQTIVLSAGVHGSEAIGVTALADYIVSLGESSLHEHYTFVIFPALNPGGLINNTDVNVLGQNTNSWALSGYDNNNNTVPHVHAVYELWNQLIDDGFVHDIIVALDLHGAKLKDGFFGIAPYTDDYNSKNHQHYCKVLGDIMTIHQKKFPLFDPGTTLGGYPCTVGSSRNPNKKSYIFTSPGVAVSLNRRTHKDLFVHYGARYALTLEYPGLLDISLRHEGMRSLVETIITHYLA